MNKSMQSDVGKALSENDIARLYHSMHRIRRVEEEIQRLYPTDKIKSPVHLSIGQEAASVGVCDVLRRDDVVFATYRGHAAYLAKGGDLKRMVAELYGKADGCGAGRSGSMHLIDVAAGVMGTSAIVGTTIPQAAGYAFSLKVEKSDRAVVCYFGDGATEEGVFHETMNFAALKRLPILFVCENNLYAIHSHIRERLSNLDFCARARSYGVPAERVKGNDIFALRTLANSVLPGIRDGGGPYFIEIETYRYARHVGPGGDLDLGYRSEMELTDWQGRDQILRVADLLPAAVRTEIDRAVEAELAEAFAFADASPFPGDDQLTEFVFHD